MWNSINAFSKTLSRPLIAVLTAALIILVLSIITVSFWYFDWNWIVYSVLVGILLGLLAGFVILFRFPRNLQIGTVGAFTGMGIDLATTAATETGPATALNSLARLIANTITAVIGAAGATGLPSPLVLPLSAGFWAFIASLALVMIIGLCIGERVNSDP